MKTLQKDEEFKLPLVESLFINAIKYSFYKQLFEKTEELNTSIENKLRTLIQ
ncbi:hypothetical protein [Psychroserpens burtonensis]|uniref:hypothetical protein n=1 Tax=Psychroserpens burtonensis TaxID=49278 RepID=UPI0003F4DA68|nr:hypothetical protein [Psychroserpens burtonensis]